MIKLKKSLVAYGAADFADVFKVEAEQLAANVLPLQQGLMHSSYVSNDKISVMILNVIEKANLIRVKAGIFYVGLIPGCNCADDAEPEEKYTEHCELLFDIDKASAETIVSFIAE